LTALRKTHARLSLSRMPSEVQLVRDLWRAHENGGVDAFFALVGEDVVWQPFLTGDRVFRSTSELRQALADLAEQGIRYDAQLHDLEQHGNVVLVHGILRVSNNGRFDETPVHWAYHFRDGRLRRQSTHATHEDALEAFSALRLLDEATFSIAEDASSEGERVIRLRGELDIESALAPRGPARGARPRRAEVHGLHRAARPPARASGRRRGPLGDRPAQRSADHPAPVRHDRRARGAAGRDVLTQRATLRPPRWA
jgi:ketosteroid isomerase-like protein